MIMPIKESLIKYVFEPAAKQVRKCLIYLQRYMRMACLILYWGMKGPALTSVQILFLSQKAELRAAVREMRGR